MSFLTPLMLFGAIAASIPVLIHLFFKSRYKTVPWAAMKFLLTSVEQTSRRLKFQELLLLLLRMALLALLAFAFARPISTVVRGSGRGDSVDAVLVIDTSFSMGALDGAKTRLQLAQDEAIKIIDELPAHSTVQIVSCAGNQKTLLGPRAPGNLDQARKIVQELELAHLPTDLSVGVAEAQEVFKHGNAANKELYVFSDMQQTGFDQQAGDLKKSLADIKEKAVVHFVRCGTRSVKNVAVVGITPQAGIPRPGERVSFAVLVRNTGSESIDNLKVSLMIDGNEKLMETQAIPKLPAKETYAVTLSGKLDKAGLRVLTARVGADELDGDNRYDQVILVREQVNILVVDGNPNKDDPEKASSFYLMHALVPVKEAERATYKYNPRMVSARLAAPAMLKDQDVCILVNCALKGKVGAEALQSDFVAALEPFVRKGHGLVIFSGDNVKPETYNQTFAKLLPLPLKKPVKVPGSWDQIADRWPEYKAKAKTRWDALSDNDIATMPVSREGVSGRLQTRYGFGKERADKETDEFGKGIMKPLLVDRQSFRFAPPAYWIFKDDEKYYRDFDKVEVWQHVVLDDSGVKGQMLADAIARAKAEAAKEADPGKRAKLDEAIQQLIREKDNQPNIVLRVNNDQPIVVSQKLDAGEVIFVATAAHHEGLAKETFIPNWSDFGTAPEFIPFMDVTISHLLHTQTQEYNLAAGQTLNWFPKDRHDNAYYLVHPDRKRVDRLGLPQKHEKRFVVTADDLPRAGVYYLAAVARASESTSGVEANALVKTGTPIAVIPDLRESADLTTLAREQINERLGFTPIHIIAGEAERASTAEERLNREWTTWALLAVMVLVLIEVVLAWWCSRSW